MCNIYNTGPQLSLLTGVLFMLQLGSRSWIYKCLIEVERFQDINYKRLATISKRIRNT